MRGRCRIGGVWAYVIVDRARDRQRAGLKRERAVVPFGALYVAERLLTEPGSVEDEAIDRAELAGLRQQVATSRDPRLRRSWNSLIELSDAPRDSRVDRDRWKYVRTRLAGHFAPDAA